MTRSAMLFGVVLLVPALAAAQEPPSYAKHIQPFFTKYCSECHPAQDADGELSLDSYKSLMQGGAHGPAIVPGKPDLSRMVRMVEGKTKPSMPPPKQKQPTKEELARLRAWVAAGARDDSAGKIGIALPALTPRQKLASPITALAYHPTGKHLVASGERIVESIDAGKGERAAPLGIELRNQITALAYSSSGDWLAVAVGESGKPAEVHLIGQGGSGETRSGHTDAVYALAFSPDNKTIASAGYDRVIKLWSVGEQKARDLKDHSDTIYGLAFSPDGKLLASASADRAVKVWDVATGARLYTLGESTDWVYGVAWSPDGKHLAAGGIDRSIRVWEVNRDGGKVVHSAFAHEGAVLRLVYSADGKTLYSLGEDRRVKAWDAAKMLETRVFDPQPEDVLSLAVRPDGKQIAVGRYDGALVLLDAQTGKVQSQPLPVKPKPPAIKKLTPAAGPRGQALTLTFETADGRPSELVANLAGVKSEIVAGESNLPAGSVRFKVTFPADAAAGVYQMKLKNEAGESNALPFTLDLFPARDEVEPNGSPRTAQPVTLPATLVGALDRAGQVDFFRFDCKQGQQIGAQVQAAAGSKLEPVLELYGPDGVELTESTTGTLGHTCAKTGSYALGVRDRDYRGEAALRYRLHLGDVPVVTSIFPLGVRHGTETEVAVDGVHLGAVKSVKVKAPADAAVGSKLPVKVTTAIGAALGDFSVVVGEFTEVMPTSERVLPVDATGNGRVGEAGTPEVWKFAANKGERLIVEVEAARLGSPLDSTLEILDARDDPVPRAVLRCVARTFSTFRDHDSVGPGIRIETWNELAVNDYLYVGSQLLRIRALPKNPDDDCQFFTEAGRREGYLGTTPGQLSMGTPMYKVTIHPPGTTFPANGFPVIPIAYRNDDAAGLGKDSRLVFDVPADGEYQLRVGDTRGQGSKRHAYRLTLRRPRPDFAVSFTPTAPPVWQGGGLPINVNVTRKDEFDGEIALKLENIPPGFSAPVSNVLAGENSTSFVLFAESSAAAPPKGAPPLKLVARAKIDGKEVVREATGGLPSIVPPGELLTTTNISEVTIKPGGEARLTVTIERLGGFKGRVPLDVRGLPHGVRVLDIGLNGILITPGETKRTIVLYCEPWVEPTEHPFVVFSKREGKNTEHAARSVLLKIAK